MYYVSFNYFPDIVNMVQVSISYVNTALTYFVLFLDDGQTLSNP